MQIKILRFVWLEEDMAFKMVQHYVSIIIRRYIVTSGMQKCLVSENEKKGL